MVKEAENYKKQDEEARDKVESKNKLENYAYSVRNTIKDEKLKDKISDSDRSTIDGAVETALKWLDSNQDASKSEFDAKMKDLEAIVNPIMTKLYQSAGGAPGAGGFPEGGFPGAGAPGAGAGAGAPGAGGPTVEEVD